MILGKINAAFRCKLRSLAMPVVVFVRQTAQIKQKATCKLPNKLLKPLTKKQVAQ